MLSWGDGLDLRIWDVKTGKRVAEYPVRPPGVVKENNGEPVVANGRVMRMMTGPASFTSDGQHLVASVGWTFYIIDSADGRIEHRVEHPGGHDISSVADAPGGLHFATSGWGRSIQRKLPDGRVQSGLPNDHHVCLFEMATGKLIRELKMPSSHAGPVAFSPDGRRLAVGFCRNAGEIRVLDAVTLEEVARLAGFGSAAHVMAFSSEGKYLITGMHDSTALVWDFDSLLARKKEER